MGRRTLAPRPAPASCRTRLALPEHLARYLWCPSFGVGAGVSFKNLFSETSSTRTNRSTSNKDKAKDQKQGLHNACHPTVTFLASTARGQLCTNTSSQRPHDQNPNLFSLVSSVCRAPRRCGVPWGKLGSPDARRNAAVPMASRWAQLQGVRVPLRVGAALSPPKLLFYGGRRGVSNALKTLCRVLNICTALWEHRRR